MRLGSKWFFFLICLLVLFVLLQTLFLFVWKMSFGFSSFLALCFALPFAFLYVRFALLRRIRILTHRTRESAAGLFATQSQVFPDDEWGELSRAVSDLYGQLKKEMDKVSGENEYCRAILAGMAEGVLLLNERGRTLMANDTAQKLLGISEKIRDKTTLEIIRDVQLEQAVQDILGGGAAKTFELSLPAFSKGFEETVFEVNVAPISPSKGESAARRVNGAIVVFHDISRLKDLERIRKDFVANVSHELRTPLTSIKGYTETLLDGAWKEEVALQFIQVIERHTDRLIKTVEDLLTLSKIESQGFRLRMEEIGVLEWIDNALNEVRERAAKKNISLSVSGVSPSLQAKGDRDYLEQVLLNLLDNAIKYTEEAGKIEISATEKESGEILFQVRDNGIGIPREDLSRIFERFYRVDKGRSKEMGGTGLGLSIVKHIVMAHGGRVWAESQPGKGSTFYFTLRQTPNSQYKT